MRGGIGNLKTTGASDVYIDMTANPAIALPGDPEGDGPRERLASLFDAHGDRLYRLARRLTGSADEARDLVQDTFFKAARSLTAVPAGTAEKEAAWLVRVLVNIPTTSGAGRRCGRGTLRCFAPARRSTPPRSSRP